jgi:hypothetical protein
MASIIRHGLPAALLLTTLASSALAHEHHTDEIPEGSGISAEPLDSILWTHIVVQTCAFGIVFPTGMVLGVRITSFSLLDFWRIVLREWETVWRLENGMGVGDA